MKHKAGVSCGNATHCDMKRPCDEESYDCDLRIEAKKEVEVIL
jgi:hypothetical protein